MNETKNNVTHTYPIFQHMKLLCLVELSHAARSRIHLTPTFCTSSYFC